MNMMTFDLTDHKDPLQAYLNEIRHTALLTKEEEIQLARRIKRGDASARDHMIRANLRLVVKIAHHYSNCGLPLTDLISEGNLGLVKAVERFDPTKGAKFSTYAAWWIKQSIRRGLANQAKTIRLPVHMMEKLTRMRRLERQLHEELGREPTHEEVADELQIPVQKVAMMKQSMMQPLSLDNSLDSESGEGTLGEIIGDESASDPSEMASGSSINRTVQEALLSLDQRSKSILSFRFGLDGEEGETLEEIGKRFKVTRERIRQLQNQALRKLRKAIQKRETPRFADQRVLQALDRINRDALPEKVAAPLSAQAGVVAAVKAKRRKAVAPAVAPKSRIKTGKAARRVCQTKRPRRSTPSLLG
jgi:RNA polymerase primary sigma factor